MLADQIAESIKNVGVKETAEIMGRALCYMAQSSNQDLEFDCDLGEVIVQRKSIRPNA